MFYISFRCLIVAMGTQKQQVTLNQCLCRTNYYEAEPDPNPTVLSLLGQKESPKPKTFIDSRSIYQQEHMNTFYSYNNLNCQLTFTSSQVQLK